MELSNYIFLCSIFVINLCSSQRLTYQPVSGYSNSYVTSNYGHGYLSQTIENDGTFSYERKSGLGQTGGYGYQQDNNNLNVFYFDQPQVSIPVLMVPMVPDYGPTYQTSEPEPGSDQPTYTTVSAQIKPSNTPKYSSLYDVNLATLLYGGQQPKVFQTQAIGDSQYDIS